MNDRALVTLTIGQSCRTTWQKYCSGPWQTYANRHNLDLIVVTEPLAPSDRPIAWQKCLIPSQPLAVNYRQIALLDADIAINHDSPNIFDQVPEVRLGGVISGSHIHDDLKSVLLSRLLKEPVPYERGLTQWKALQDWYYTDRGLMPQPAGIVNTGVLVASPAHHAALFRGVFESENTDTRQYEQIRLSHAILSASLFHQIDTRFNSVLYETLLVHHHYLFAQSADESIGRAVVRAELANNFFLHFAYDQTLMRLLVD